MAIKQTKPDILEELIFTLLKNFKHKNGLTLEIRESILYNTYDIVASNGTDTFSKSIRLDKSPFKLRTVKRIQKEFKFSKVEKSKYGQSKITFS